jgi:O-methyltransferase
MAKEGTLKQSIVKKNMVILFNKTFSKRFSVAICSSMSQIMGRKRSEYVYGEDIIRYSSLELVSQEIYDKEIKGNVAELGVYRGDFAQYINVAFPDRKLYLFDTFEGFNKKDVVKDKLGNYVGKVHDFSKTNVDIVLKKMKYKENCIVRKGYFPETAEGLEDSFVFVSIDTDLYEPIYNGLKYFYPRLTKGGYIFVHDYNNIEQYGGTRAAVKKYCDENKIGYFPLSDIAGSAVIVK